MSHIILYFFLPCTVSSHLSKHPNHFHYVWFQENTNERKKNVKENDFLMFSFTIKNKKENQNIIKIS